MALVDVVNRNTHPFNATFKGDKISIPAGGKIKMDHEDAVVFLGEKSPILRDGNDQQKPESYKRLFIEGVVALGTDQAKFTCHMDGKVFDSKAALDAYVEANHSESLEDPLVAEAMKKNKGGRPKAATV